MKTAALSSIVDSSVYNYRQESRHRVQTRVLEPDKTPTVPQQERHKWFDINKEFTNIHVLVMQTGAFEVNRSMPGRKRLITIPPAGLNSYRLGVVLIDKPNERRRGPPQLRCSLAVALDHPGACWIMLRSSPGAVAGRSR